jgi:hypothetical protein
MAVNYTVDKICRDVESITEKKRERKDATAINKAVLHQDKSQQENK